MSIPTDFYPRIRVKDSPVAMFPKMDDSAAESLFTSDAREGLLLESCSLSEVENAYIGHELVNVQYTAMFEAISTTRSQLSRSMRAFIRRLNSALASHNITAGTKEGDPDSEDGIGGAEISKVRKIAGIPIIVARIPLSDGQSVSFVFHSPTSNGNNITASDTLTVFRFLLNKRDVTHVVAPQNGADISLAQVTTYMAKLIGLNSTKFARSQSIAKRTRDELDAAEADANNLLAQQESLTEQANSLTAQADTAEAEIVSVTDKATKAEAKTAQLTQQRDELQAQLEDLRNRTPEVNNAHDAFTLGYTDAQTGQQSGMANLDEAFAADYKKGWNQFLAEQKQYLNTHGNLDGFIPNPNPTVIPLNPDDVSGGDKRPGLSGGGKDLTDASQKEKDDADADKDREKGEHEDRTSALFWYGLRLRAAAPGSVPSNPAATLTADETAELEIVKKRGITPDNFRFGAVGYSTMLTPSDLDAYDLVDFSNLITGKTNFEALDTLHAWVNQMARTEEDMTFTEFWATFFNPRGDRTDEVPFKNGNGQFDGKGLMLAMRQHFPKQSPAAVIENWWNEVENDAEADATSQLAPMAVFGLQIQAERPKVPGEAIYNALVAGQYDEDSKLPAQFIRSGAFNAEKLNKLLKQAYPRQPEAIAYAALLRDTKAGQMTDQLIANGAEKLLAGLKNRGIELPDNIVEQIQTDEAAARAAVQASSDAAKFFATPQGKAQFGSVNDAIIVYIVKALTGISPEVTGAVEQLQKMLIFTSDDPAAWEDLKDQLSTLRVLLGKNGQIQQNQVLVEQVEQYIQDGIAKISTSQRDIDTGEKAATYITYPVPADLSEMSSKDVSDMVQRMNFVTMRLGMIKKAFATSTIQGGNDELAEQSKFLEDVFMRKGASTDEWNAFLSLLAPIQTSSRDGFTNAINDRIAWVNKLLEPLEAERQKRRAEFIAGKADREARNERIRAAVKLLENTFDLTPLTIEDLDAGDQEVADAIKVLNDEGVTDQYTSTIAEALSDMASYRAEFMAQNDTTSATDEPPVNGTTAAGNESIAAALAVINYVNELDTDDQARLTDARQRIRVAANYLKEQGQYEAHFDKLDSATKNLSRLMIAVANKLREA